MRFLFILLLFIITSQVKSINIDSLQRVIDKMPDDSNKVNYIFSLSEKFYKSDSEIALKFYKHATQISTSIKNDHLLALSYYNQANYFKSTYNFDSVFYYSSKGILLFEKEGNTEGVCKTKLLLINVYIARDQIADAKKIIDDCLALYKNQKTKSTTLAELYCKYGSVYFIKENYAEAQKLYEKGIAIFFENQDSVNAYIYISNISDVYFYLKLPDKAIESMHKVIDFQKREKNYFEVSKTYCMLAEGIQNFTNNSQLTFQCYDSAYRYANLSTNYFMQGYVYRGYYQAFQKEKDFEKAFDFLLKYKDYSDSLGAKMYNEKVLSLETQYKMSEKEKEILLLQEKNKSEKRMKLLILFIGLSLILIFIIWYNKYRIKQKLILQNQKTEVLELEQKLLRSQMNPHFIFNALGAIQSFIQKNEKDEATSYLSKFSRLIRLILENSRLNYVSLAKELKSLQDYLQLQQLLFDNKFDYNIDVDEKIDIENINIPPMLAQPFIENALKHGLANSDKKGMLNISFKLKDNLILFDVVDNGVGLQKALELKPMSNAPHQSLATEITKERLNNMNKKLGGKKINIIVQELTGKMNEIIGTKVTFEIPFQYSV